jgi:hypothetical protein
LADAMTDDAFSDGAQTMTTMHDGMPRHDIRGLVAVKNTFLVCEDEAEDPTPLELRRGVSEPAPKVATVEEEDEEEDFGEEVDFLPPPSRLDRLQTLESWEDIKDWQYTAGNAADPQMPYVDMSSQLTMASGPVETRSSGISLESMAPQQPPGGQVYFPVPGVMPPAFAQNQPMQMMQPVQPMGQMQMPMGQQMQPMMQQPMPTQPMQPMQPMHSMPNQQGQPMQLMRPMQPNLPVVMPGFESFRGSHLPMSVDLQSVRQQGGQSELGTATRPVNPDYDLAEMIGVPEEAPEKELKAPEPLGLRQQLSMNSKVYRVHWTQPDKFLRSTNKNAVSPSFQIYGADWKLVLAAETPDRNDASFKVSKGRCSMKLKCEKMQEGTSALTIMFRFFAGDMPVRGPAMHDFKNGKALAGLKRTEDAWDLLSQVKDMKVTVGVELWEVAYEVQSS